MVFSIKAKILFIISLSILFTYAGMLYVNYDDISEIIPTHINFKGEIDGYGNKIQLWVATGVNIILLLILFLVAKNPKYANYPVEITDENRNSVYGKMRIFLGILSILVSCVFSTMILLSLKYTAIEMLRLFLFIVVMPGFFIVFFKEKTPHQ